MCLKEILLLAGFAFTSIYPSDDAGEDLLRPLGPWQVLLLPVGCWLKKTRI